MFTYKYDKRTGEYLYAEKAILDPLETAHFVPMPPVEKDEEGNELPVVDDRLERLEEATQKVYLLPADSTFDIPPYAKEGYAAKWNGTKWEIVEDHRQKQGKGGTAYWMPGDTWQTPARYMAELGKLPEGAMLEKPEKPQDVILKELETQYTAFVQHILDKEAQKLGYDNCNSVCTYVDTGVAKFDAEGVAFRKWRSAVWAKGYELLAEVQAGTRPIPTEEELVKLLPKLEIVYA